MYNKNIKCSPPLNDKLIGRTIFIAYHRIIPLATIDLGFVNCSVEYYETKNRPASQKANASHSKQWVHRVLHIFGVKWQTNYSRTKLPNEQCPNKQTKKKQ